MLEYSSWSEREREVRKLKVMYPIGTKVVLEHMDDPHPVPDGMTGIVKHIDDIGQIHVQWDNGLYLALIHGLDQFNKI